MTLLTVVYAGRKRLSIYRGASGTYQFASKAKYGEHFEPASTPKSQYQQVSDGSSTFRLRVITWNDKPRFSNLFVPSWHASLIAGLSFIAP